MAKGPHRGRRESFRERRREFLDPDAVRLTIDRLVDEGRLSAEGGESLHHELPEILEQSGYTLRHLGAHIAIGAVFAFDLIPLPLGTISRVSWVLGNRVFESVRGQSRRARVHSLKVLLIAAIPWVGYGAYLLPLRNESVVAASLYANHLSYSWYGLSAEQYLATRPRMVGRLVGWLVPSLAPRRPENTRCP